MSVRLYNASCPPLIDLLAALKRHPGRGPTIWERVLLLSLRRMAGRQEGLARVTAAEILSLLSLVPSPTRPQPRQRRTGEPRRSFGSRARSFAKKLRHGQNITRCALRFSTRWRI